MSWWPQKHKIFSIIVPNLVKYTIISLMLIDLVPKFFNLNLFQRKSQVQKSSKLFLGGGEGGVWEGRQLISKKSQPRPFHFGPSPKFPWITRIIFFFSLNTPY